MCFGCADKIVRLLGQGTFGKVVEAVNVHTQQRVAVKIIRAIKKYRDASAIEIRALNELKAKDPLNRKSVFVLYHNRSVNADISYV